MKTTKEISKREDFVAIPKNVIAEYIFTLVPEIPKGKYTENIPRCLEDSPERNINAERKNVSDVLYDTEQDIIAVEGVYTLDISFGHTYEVNFRYELDPTEKLGEEISGGRFIECRRSHEPTIDEKKYYEF